MVEPWLGGIRRVDAAGRQLRSGHLLEDMERKLIESTLQECRGHRAKTAAALGIGVRTLGLKLKRWREEAKARERYQMAG
jgi:DNA-binding NtrC family response regulator